MKSQDLLKIFGKDSRERVFNAIDCLKNGKGILLVDDEDRENEGDLIFPAETMSISDMATMIRECSGIVCLCIKQNHADRLGLSPMVQNNTSSYGTNFTQSIEAASGVTTGVSAHDRITTIQTAISEQSTPESLHMPGHIFPLIAKEGGVFERPGHTEGSVDLVALAGFNPCAILCELTNRDGTMAKMPEIAAFALNMQTTVVSIADIISFKRT